MKKIYILLVLCLFAVPAISQENTNNTGNQAVDPRISEVFADQLQQLVLSDPQRLKNLNAILNQRYEVVDFTYKSDEKHPKLSSVRLFNKYNPNLQRDVIFDKSTFNILRYDLDFYAPTDKIYRIDDTNLIIIVHPQNLRK